MIVGLGVLLLGLLVTAMLPACAPQYGAFASGVTLLVLGYQGANVSQDLVASKLPKESTGDLPPPT